MTKDRLDWVIRGLDWEKLSSWEEKFVESVETFFKKNGYLSENQEDKLEEIYRKKSR
jgi:hypothetical protein